MYGGVETKKKDAEEEKQYIIFLCETADAEEHIPEFCLTHFLFLPSETSRTGKRLVPVVVVSPGVLSMPGSGGEWTSKSKSI